MLKRIFGPGRMLVESADNRILVGVASFLGIIVVMGWIAINEPGRMRAFDRQFVARSTERGGEIFVSACATCHGGDGRGILGRAPALNNPQLFGHDFFPQITAQVGELESERDALQTALNDRENPVSDERRAQINARIEEIDGQINELGEQVQGEVSSAIRVGYEPLEFDRLEQVGWQGGLESFLTSTITSGRPVSNAYWPQAMPAWGQLSGGPLRTDEIEDVVRYIMNWEREWALDDLTAIRQFAVTPCDPARPDTCDGLETVSAGDGEGAPTLSAGDVAGSNVDAILAALEMVAGDAAQGQSIYQSQGCSACHAGGSVGPATAGTATRVTEERLTDPALEGYSSTQYLVESIVDPGAFVAPGFPDGVMPASFGQVLTVQDVAHLVAYLESQTE